MSDLEEFSKRIPVMVKAIEGLMNSVMRRAIIVADQVLVTSTPVDTGRARGNWVPAIGAAAVGEIYAPDPHIHKTAEAEATQVSLDATISEVQKFSVADEVFTITNNVPYIEALENGSSKQAPNGMVAGAYAAVHDFVKDLG